MTYHEATACVCCFFRDIECPKHITGYNYLKSALVDMMEREHIISNITKTVYIYVAEKYDTDVANVERCLRTLVDKWWTQSRCSGLFDSKPTNKQLVVSIVDKLQDDLVNEIIKEQKRKERREELARIRLNMREVEKDNVILA